MRKSVCVRERSNADKREGAGVQGVGCAGFNSRVWEVGGLHGLKEMVFGSLRHSFLGDGRQGTGVMVSGSRASMISY